MSSFQFKCYLIPTGQEPGGLQYLYDEDEDNALPEINYGISRSVIGEMFNNRLALHNHWGQTYEYGKEDDDEIWIYTKADNETIEILEARINCIKDFRPFLDYICRFAKNINCKILYKRNKQYFEPNYEVLFAVIMDSWPRMLAQDPVNFPFAAEDRS